MSDNPAWRPDMAELTALRDALRRAGNASLELDLGDVHLRMTPAAPAAAAPAADAPPAPPDGPTLNSDGPGILRLADPAGGAPFVTAGTSLREGQIVALLEAGGALWPVRATADGRVETVLGEDGSVVGYGTPLFRLAP